MTQQSKAESATQLNGATPKSASETGIQIAIARIYGKNHQFEIKGSPMTVLASEWKPVIDLKANPRFTEMNPEQYEVVLALQLSIKQSEELTVQIYWEQAGLFTLTNVPPNQLEMLLYGACPNMLFPYVGVMVNQSLSSAGLPPVYLAPLDFVALYRQHLTQQQQQKAQPAQQPAA